MRRAVLGVVMLVASGAFADGVRGYEKKDGTRVEPYERTRENKTKDDNYSTRGNTNPYTGKKGTKPRDEDR